MPGFDSNFLGAPYMVDLPDYSFYKGDIARNNKDNTDILDYTYYSVLQSRSRKVPVFSASNIFRTQFTQIDRAGTFKKESRINDHEQLTTEDYKSFNSVKAETIEKGHMTKREDVQWDEKEDPEKAEAAARSTFYYPNAAPQHDRLNNGLWKYLENSIILKGGGKLPSKVLVFTGPVLSTNDPQFKVPLSDKKTTFKMPVVFWKIVYYLKPDNKLYYASFLMGQLNLLRKDGLIIEKVAKGITKEPKQFLIFKENEKYQVSVSYIEELTKLKFTKAIDKHEGMKPVELNEVQAKGRLLMATAAIPQIKNLNV
jgi:endonuclease G, mitochondrial